jgi:hypothetical protein
VLQCRIRWSIATISFNSNIIYLYWQALQSNGTFYILHTRCCASLLAIEATPPCSKHRAASSQTGCLSFLSTLTVWQQTQLWSMEMIGPKICLLLLISVSLVSFKLRFAHAWHYTQLFQVQFSHQTAKNKKAPRERSICLNISTEVYN